MGPATTWPPVGRTPLANRRRRWKLGCPSTRRTRTRPKARRSCWPSSPRWRWRRCRPGSPTRAAGSRRRTRWRGSRRTATTTTTTTIAQADAATMNPRHRRTANSNTAKRWNTPKSIKVYFYFLFWIIYTIRKNKMADNRMGFFVKKETSVGFVWKAICVLCAVGLL